MSAVQSTGSHPESPQADVVVRLSGAVKRFGTTTVLNGIDMTIAAGEFVALLGRSGCGKTTLLRTLAGLEPLDAGSLHVTDATATVFQEPRLMPWKRAWRNVTLGLRCENPRNRAERALREVGLDHRLNAWPATLSGGEAQRVSLARALVREPALLLLDEPFAALDALTRVRMHELVIDLWRAHGPAVLLVTHDVDEAILLADRLIVLSAGAIVRSFANPAPRPRRADLPDFQSLRQRLLDLLGNDEREALS